MAHCTRKCLTVGLLLTFIALRGFAQENGTFDPSGDWIGTLKVSAMELRVIFRVVDTDSGFSATMDSPDQGARGIPVSGVIHEEDSLHLLVAVAMGRFDGKVVDDTTVAGTWKQGGLSLPLCLTRMTAPLELNRPQEPKPPYPYEEEEVVFENTAEVFNLAGTLTYPREGGPHPAVVLVTGSGAQDRNETIFGHKPFHVLADYLTRRGIAVLRYDDRGVGKSGGDPRFATTEDLAGDALAAVSYLKERSDIDAKRIGVIGHSEGGIIAPMAALKDPEIAFVVMIAGSGVPGIEVIVLQAERIMRASGSNEEDIEENRARQRELFTIITTEDDTARCAKLLREKMRLWNEEAPADRRLNNEDLETRINAQLMTINSPWFRYFLRYDPADALRKLTIPVLAVIGEKDLQVLPDQNLEPIENALKEAGNRHYAVKMLPGLNHLLQTAETGLITEYGKIEETMSPAALKVIGDWLVDVTNR